MADDENFDSAVLTSMDQIRADKPLVRSFFEHSRPPMSPAPCNANHPYASRRIQIDTQRAWTWLKVSDSEDETAVPMRALRESTAMKTDRWLALIATSLLACSTSSSGADAGSDAGASDGGDAGGVCLPLDAGLPASMPFIGISGDAGLTPDTFIYDWAWANCDFASRCAPFASYLVPACIKTLSQGGGGALVFYSECSAGSCLSDGYSDLGLVDGGPWFYGPDLAAVDAGTEVFEQAQARASLAAPIGCGEAHGYFPLFFVGIFSTATPVGGVCASNADCIGDAGGTFGTCALDAGPHTGVCIAGANSVSPFNDCMTTGCSGNTPVCDPSVGVCRRADGGQGAPCITLTDCSAGYFCAWSGSHFTCQPQIASGGSCQGLGGGDFFFPWSGECAGSNACGSASQGPDGGLLPGVCQAQAGADVGGSCLAPNQPAGYAPPSSGVCVSGLTCSCGVCVPSPSVGPCAAVGTPCRQDIASCSDNKICEPL